VDIPVADWAKSHHEISDQLKSAGIGAAHSSSFVVQVAP
jgi:hypothetical protein